MEQIATRDFLLAISNGQSLEGKIVDQDMGPFDMASSRGSAHIKNCQLRNFLFPNVNYATFEIVDTVIEEMTFENVRIDHLKIIGSTIRRLNFRGFNSRALHIEGNSTDGIVISGGSVGQVLIHNNRTPSVEVRNAITETFKVSGINSSLNINQVSLQGTLPSISIDNQKLTSLILTDVDSATCKIHSAEITKQVVLNGGSCGELEIKTSIIALVDALNQLSNLSIHGSEIRRIRLTKSFVSISTRRSDGISGDDCRIETLDMCHTAGKLQINSATISELLINDFSAAKGSRLSNLTILKSLSMENATIESVRFHNANLSSASIRLLNSSMSKTELINVEWPRKSELYEYSSELKGKTRREKLNVLWPLKESYRQLKVLSLKQLNKIDALAFQKHELKIYWRIVNINTFSSLRLKGFGSWLILFTNWIFSDFGQSIRRPIGWLLFFQSIFVYSLLRNFELGIALDFEPSNWDWEATKTGIGMYLNLMNPIHSTELKNEFMTRPISIYGITDFTMRIMDGYLIYYFIRASRKFNLSL